MNPSSLIGPLPLSQVFESLLTSFEIALGTAVLSTAWGIFVALALYHSGTPATAGRVSILLLPFCWPPFMTAIGWMVVQGESGITLFQKDSFESWGLTLLFSRPGTIFIESLSYWPVVALIGWWGFHRLDREILDPLRLDGVSLFRSSVVLCRLSITRILTAALLVVVFSLGEMGVPELLQVSTFPLLLYSELNLTRSLSAATRTSLPLLLFMGAGMALWTLLHHRLRIESIFSGPGRKPVPRISKGWAVGFSGLLLLAGPGIVVTTEVFQIFRDLPTIHLPLLTECLTASLLTGAGAVLLAGLFLLPGLALSRNRTLVLLLDGFSFLLFVLPSALLALLILRGCSALGTWFFPFLDSFWVLSTSCAIRFFWIAWMMVRTGEEQISDDLLDRMKMEGLNPVQRVRYILLPLLKTQTGIGLYFVWALTLGEVTLTRILQPPGVQTLAARTVNFMHWGHDAMVSAGLLMVAVLEFLPLLIFLGWRTLREMRR